MFLKSTCISPLQLDKLKFRDSGLSHKYYYDMGAYSLANVNFSVTTPVKKTQNNK